MLGHIYVQHFSVLINRTFSTHENHPLLPCLQCDSNHGT